MGLHGSTLSKADAKAMEVKQTAQLEVQALVGQRGIAHSGATSLVALLEEFFDSQILVGRIAPQLAAHKKVPHFRCRFSQTVSQGLTEQAMILVCPTPLLHLIVNRRGKKAYSVGHALLNRTHEVSQAETRLSLRRMLLTEQRDAFAIIWEKDVIAIADSRTKSHAEMCMKSGLVPGIEHALRFIKEFHCLARTDALSTRKTVQPVLAASHTAVNTSDTAIAGREAPGMEEVKPVDIAGHIMNPVMKRLILQ